MNIKDIPVPEIYKESKDFRFFLRWFEYIFDKLKYDTENLLDIYDPLKCPKELLWLLGDTVGFKYDDRLPAAFNRLVLLYFMSMIRLRGSKDGVTLAAEVNLAQFNVIEYGKEKQILNNRLEDTSIPVNSVYVTPHTAAGYIDVVYFSDKSPIDACIEYVRPLGMYIFQNSGVRMDAKARVVIDGRLCNTNDVGISIGPTHIGHYSRRDYASMQQHRENAHGTSHKRDDVWYRNADYEGEYTPNKSSDNQWIDPGYRTLYSLQLCNNDHIVKSILPGQITEKIFGIGYEPVTEDVIVQYPDNYILPDREEKFDNSPEGLPNRPLDVDGHIRVPNAYNLRYDREREYSVDDNFYHDVYTIENDPTAKNDILHPQPAVNPVMAAMGDAIALKDDNTEYTKVTDDGIKKEEYKDIND